MGLSPLDVAQRQFATAWRGFEPDAVQAFLQEVSQRMADLVQENHEQRARLQVQQELLDGLRAREDDVKEAMVTAQKAIEQQRTSADQDAALKVEAAELKAKEIVLEAERRLAGLNSQVGELSRQRISLIEELRSVLATHIRTLELYGSEEARPRKDGRAHRGNLEMLAAPPPPTFLEATGRPSRSARRSEGRAARPKE